MKTLGQIGYEAYAKSAVGYSFAPWDETKPEIRDACEAFADTVRLHAFSPIDPSIRAEDLWVQSFNQISQYVHVTAIAKGWWEKDRNDGEQIALIHAELSEWLESLRHGDGPSDHIPSFCGSEEEAADVLIRILDWAAVRGWRVGEALIAKAAFNKTRPVKHGGKKF